MTPLEKAKHHLATYGAAHVECCGTPIVRDLVRQLEETQSDFTALQRALVGTTGLSAIEEAHRLRALHPII